MNPYIQLAKEAIESYLREGKKIIPQKDLPKEMVNKRAGVFVSLHIPLPLKISLKKVKSIGQKQLRGCIGTFLPTQENIAQEIIENAIAAATSDPRFPPLRVEEIDNLEISVDILSEPEPISSPNLLDPKKYGVIVRASDGRTGLLLPDLEGIDNALHQVAIASQKAGISPNEPCSLYRFRVKRHQES